MSRAAFLAAQEVVYEKFRAAQRALPDTGVQPDAALDSHGAVLCYRFAPDASLRVLSVAEQVAECVPAIRYGPENTHVTVAAFERADAAAVAAAVDAVPVPDGDLHVRFAGALANRTTVIFPGEPSQELWSYSNALQNACQDFGAPVRPAWGSHLTVARFVETCPVDGRLVDVLAAASAHWAARPEAVEVAAFEVTAARGFELTPTHRVRLDARQ